MAVDLSASVKLLLTPPEAARALSISPRTLWAITAPRGDLPCVRLAGRSVRYSVDAIRAWIADQQVAGAPGNGGPADGQS
jgi:predicted DNA-binding transcriptional regulator AlpA